MTDPEPPPARRGRDVKRGAASLSLVLAAVALGLAIAGMAAGYL